MEKLKNRSGVIVALVAVIVIVICFFATSGVAKEGEGLPNIANTGNITQNAEIESAAVKDSERKKFENITVDEYLDIYEDDEKVVVLLGSTQCGYSQIAEPILQNIAYKYDLTMYYLNVAEFAGDDQSNLMVSNEHFSEGFGTPMLLVVSDEKIHDVIEGLVDTTTYLEFFKTNGIINK